MSLRNCLVVVWVYVVYAVGTCLFLSGYLMKHHIVYRNSTLNVYTGNSIKCQEFSSLRNLSEEFIQGLDDAVKSNSPKSLLQRYNKAVIVVIDALRYDFVNSSDSSDRDGEFYLNKMPVFKALVKEFPHNAVLLPLIADPPTTTLQRLKGITTGSLPTFIDVSQNFASSEIDEDNIIRQMNKLNKTIVFMGDDTWDSIFPNHFSKSYFYPSFNVKDLDTVDNGIIDRIYEEIKNNSTDVLIAHFLGVDHCGHRYGPKHPEMTRKLMQMNYVIEKIVGALQKDAILLVLGDHGMTNTGDHGGDSPKETSTALFLYSPSKVIYNDNVHNYQAIAQIDIVPTLSLLLGLPIPFSNLGSVIPELFSIRSDGVCFHEYLDALLGGALAAAENALQVHRYLKTYSFESNDLDSSFIKNAEDKLRNISDLWKNINDNVTLNIGLISEIQLDYLEYTKTIFKILEKKWASFDYNYMNLGLFVLCLGVFANICSAEHIRSRTVMLICTLFVFVLVLLSAFDTPLLLLPTIITFCTLLTFAVYFKRNIFWSFSLLFNIQSLVLFLLFVCSFSNSFVVYEDRIILYLLQSIILYKHYPFVINFFKTCFQSGKVKPTKHNQKVKYFELLLLMCLMLCIRIGSVFFKCREEQISCINSNFILSLEKLNTPQSYKIFRLFLSLASVIIPVVIFLYLSSYKSSMKYGTATAVSIRYGLFFVCVFTSLRWWLNIVSPEAVERILKGNEVVLTRAASFISVTMSTILIFFPILSEKPWTLSSKEIYSESLGTFLFIVSQLLNLIAGDAISCAITLMCASILLLVILGDLSSNLGESQVWTDVLIWNLLSRYWFYASAHQATFSSVQWDAAFLLNHKEIYSYALSGALVVLNTFSSNILFGMAFPALLIWSQPTACSPTSIRRLHLKYIFCFGTKLLSHAAAALILRHHLMAWKIFSPRLIYEVIGTIITMITSCIGHYFILSVVSQYHKLIRKNLGHMFSDKNQ